MKCPLCREDGSLNRLGVWDGLTPGGVAEVVIGHASKTCHISMRTEEEFLRQWSNNSAEGRYHEYLMTIYLYSPQHESNLAAKALGFTPRPNRGFFHGIDVALYRFFPGW